MAELFPLKSLKLRRLWYIARLGINATFLWNHVTKGQKIMKVTYHQNLLELEAYRFYEWSDNLIKTGQSLFLFLATKES